LLKTANFAGPGERDMMPWVRHGKRWVEFGAAGGPTLKIYTIFRKVPGLAMSD